MRGSIKTGALALLGGALLAAACGGAPAESGPVAEVHGRAVAPRSTVAEAAAWVRPGRADRERRDLLFNGLNVVPGMTACEVGAGNGFYTLELARLVYPGGKVIAVDIQPEMLDALAEREARARKRGDQMVPIRREVGAADGTPLPDRGCDVLLLAHTWHELERPDAMRAAFIRAIAPNGRLVVVEHRAEDPPPKAGKLRVMDKDQMHRELADPALKLVGQIDSLPWQHVLFYARADSPRPGVQLRPYRRRSVAIEPDAGPPDPEGWDGDDVQ